MLLKVKGITLNTTNRGKINFEALRDLVLDYGINPDSDDPKKTVIQQCSITRNKQKWVIENKALLEDAEGGL